ncbi:addiction module antidote protein [Dyella nitratireducens]|nr:addiction module antidote protein [Dyella nitratireducens]
MSDIKYTTFDFSRYLDNPKTIASYLEAILEEKDAGLLAAALGDIAKARGMTEIANASGLTREALYKALKADSSPRFDTITRVLDAFNLELKISVKKGQQQTKGKATRKEATHTRTKSTAATR